MITTEDRIDNALYDFQEELVNNGLIPVGITVYGSHLYGIAHENSDIDIRAIHLPSKDEILRGDIVSVYESPNGDYVSLSLHKFFNTLMNGSINALELLYAIDIPEFKEFEGLFNPKWIDATQGFVTKHSKRYPNDLKAARHSYRASLILNEIWTSGVITFPHDEKVRAMIMDETDCEKLYKMANAVAAVISLNAAKLPAFRQENFIAKCYEARDRIYSNHIRKLFQ